MSRQTVDEIEKFYDNVTDPYVEAWDGNLHMGYWESATANPSIVEATERLTGEVIGRLRVAPGDRVLDVGCGIGKPALRLARERGVNVTGVSISEQQIGVAKASARAVPLPADVEFQTADAMDLPFPDSSFDAVLCLEALHHMPDRPKALREIARVVRPGGSVVVADFALRGPVPERHRELVDRFAVACNLVTLTTIDDYAREFAEAGLDVIEIGDVSANVQPSMAQHAQAVRAARDRLGPIVGGDRLDQMVDLTERYAALPQFGYVVLAGSGRETPGDGTG
ncbi:methyltransferase domain-containing protein [Sphaerisporangium sp. TRM90804]|uniref:methyltransferase domain-containing protein n=1 Tax=Sphaerisporangium sp. TRM90804 TaxID=3031113 RepID=UPI002446BDA0|nr:methyltransferase domain-containing protein [Sphaerisporangium sp. TRM90804]MDH2427310.1 methyltransferase domain-containing protein [Sphaerisporangium sp. TRM90804]